jgi:hypothetical protein
MSNGVCSWFCAGMMLFSDKIYRVFYIKVVFCVGISVSLRGSGRGIMNFGLTVLVFMIKIAD